MAVDMFIKIGDIKGEANDKTHKESVDVLAWSWGLSQSGTTHMGSGGGAGKVNVQDLSFTKYVDASSHALIMACCKGTHYDQALLTVRKAGDNPLEYIKITMKEVMVTSLSTGGSGGEDRLTENVTLNFAEVKYEYTKQAVKGGKDTTMTAEWNIAENTGEIK
ncbi:Hcp family type VI secretion system effector [Cognatazoarcus halotolerans]|uniref:Hcp family type VI secretion system effector n=1 Tax=Cognatazoarcus halotolerans TaxID=2686016 RepID=UPI0013569AC6|nr:type VI secretion system tube protein Hcp [Cognatazoarcus halotolerans]MBX3679380.1 type VI secretion system tube protein Hcp [Rhodocyclaceae bacterium]MCB1899689.1 type VI secretion system tube protein Hcp [Rhodocyclaceae bacterium]MCP5309330.1 type VI secretion system tube protein Hcp [Zoogloeaceae bacterium]